MRESFLCSERAIGGERKAERLNEDDKVDLGFRAYPVGERRGEEQERTKKVVSFHHGVALGG